MVQVMMARGCIPEDAPVATLGQRHETWAAQIYEQLSGAPDGARRLLAYSQGLKCRARKAAPGAPDC